MIQLSISAAFSYVRKALDELTSVEDIGMLASPDAIDLHRLVEGAIVEAVIRTHNAAPSLFIDGELGKEGEDYEATLENGVVTIEMLKDTLRLASLKAEDSDIVITELIAEDSPEGRMQLNKYVRGVPDDPRLVLCKQWKGEYRPVFRYYSTREEACPGLNLEYVPYPVIDETIVMICPRLEYAVLNEIVAMVLDSLNEHEKAAIYRSKSIEGK